MGGGLPPMACLAAAVWMTGAGACGGGGKAGPAGGGSGGASGPIGSGSTICDVPAAAAAVDTSNPTTVVGMGSPASCTASSLDAAVQKAGVITFDCGPDPVTITLGQQIRINNQGGADMLGDTVIDGGGKVTLSGGGTTRILYLQACQPPYNSDHCDTFDHPHLTVQNLRFSDGNVNDPVEGGGAIFANGGALTIIDSTFTNNSCAVVGQEVKGGAVVTTLQTDPVYIVGCTFSGNSCQSGGAVGSIGTSYQIINSAIMGNMAVGNGGGIANDGGRYDLSLCGTTLSDNTATAYGGGLFYVSNDGTGTITIDSSTVSGNRSTTTSHTGGLYLQGAKAVIRDSTVAANAAGFAAGIFATPNAAGNSLDLVNVTVTGQAGTGLEIDPAISGTFLNSTIAGNQRGISSGALVELTNSIVAGNSAGDCTAGHPSGGGNVQFPAGGTACTADVTFADPQLGALADNGGPTQTLLPAAGSPAIGAANACPADDQRGQARPANACTSGAVEVP